MTCIVGLVAADGTVHLGGDSAGIAGYDLTVRKDPKVFRVGEFVVGGTSSFRMIQLLRFAFTPPPIEGDLDAYMVTTFVNALRDCFKAGGYAREDSKQESGGCFLVGIRGRLYRIDSDYQVGEALAEFDAVGCGQDVARGALYATPHMPPQHRLQTALYAAEAWNAGVRAPFTFVASLPTVAGRPTGAYPSLAARA